MEDFSFFEQIISWRNLFSLLINKIKKLFLTNSQKEKTQKPLKETSMSSSLETTTETTDSTINILFYKSHKKKSRKIVKRTK